MKFYRKYILLILIAVEFSSCDDFVEVETPRTELIKSSVFNEANTAEAAIVDLYIGMRSDFGGGSPTSVSGLASLSADELVFYGNNTVSNYQQFNENSLTPNNDYVTSLWSEMYNTIYKTNTIIEGLSSSELPLSEKNQFIGEAKFVRAFSYFYLVNLWGDVPLVTSTDYLTNNSVIRSASTLIYDQIEDDLLESIELLAADYPYSNGERIRASKGAARALLARVYLFMENWEGAETQATLTINDPLYSLEPDLSLVFRSTSPEAILQLWFYQYPTDRSTFSIGRRGPGLGSLSSDFLSMVEAGDQRWDIWGQPRDVDGTTYYGMLKYFDFSNPPLDYTTLLRLAEQYLIRAEARVRQNMLTGAADDLNIVRSRAGLPETEADTQQELLDAILHERRYELCTEWGHRWFDLNRTGRADEVLGSYKPSWNSEDKFYPIPEVQIANNPGIAQNPGY